MTWRDVWKLMRRLFITGRKHVLLQEVRGFVDSLLRRLLDGLKDNGSIDACEIVFNWGDGNEYVNDIEIMRALGRWIPHVLKCKVKSLRVDNCRNYGSGTIPMRDIPLVSRHLTRLELSGLWFFSGSHIVSGSLDFSECPVLEHLEITNCEMMNVDGVTSPSVKHLVITDCFGCVYDSLEICFPLMVSMRLEAIYDKNLMLNSMPQLVVAYVSIDNHPREDDSDDEQDITKCMVLEGLAEAKHLVLLPDDRTITFTRDLRFCPTFSNLKTLVLNHYCWCESADCSALACMLQHVPVLEKLTVLFSSTVKSKYDMVVEGRPDATENSTMISQHLKVVELKYFKVDQKVVNVLKFLRTLNIKFPDTETEGSK